MGGIELSPVAVWCAAARCSTQKEEGATLPRVCHWLAGAPLLPSAQGWSLRSLWAPYVSSSSWLPVVDLEGLL